MNLETVILFGNGEDLEGFEQLDHDGTAGAGIMAGDDKGQLSHRFNVGLL